MCLLLLFPPALEHGWLSDTTFNNLGSTLQSHFSVAWQVTKLLIAGAHRKLREAWERAVQTRERAVQTRERAVQEDHRQQR